MKDPITDFLDQKRIAICGVSRSKDQPANINYRKLRDLGYRVFAVNPKAGTVEGDPCYPSLSAVPEPVDGVLAFTPPEQTMEVARECVDLGIPRLWMHRSFGRGSVSDSAARLCRENRIQVIPGGCPMMFRDPVDFGHRCMRWVLRLAGSLPKAA